MSRSHLYPVFISNVGQSPIDYLTSYRISEACHLLRNSQLSIAEIAVSVGFFDQFYFSRVFKKAKGVPQANTWPVWNLPAKLIFFLHSHGRPQPPLASLWPAFYCVGRRRDFYEEFQSTPSANFLRVGLPCSTCALPLGLADGKRCFYACMAVVLFTDKNGATYLDSDRLAQQLTDCTLYTLDAEGDAAAQLEELQRTQKRKTVRAAIVAADDRTTATSLAQQLAETGLPVILAGAAPEEGLVETGNIWYVGGDPASGGELLGAALASDWNGGILPDLNGDYLMQYILRGQEETSLSNPLLQAVLNECEHYGIFSNPVEEEPDQTLSDELSQIEQAQQDARDGETPAADAEDIPVVLSLGSTPEAILWAGPKAVGRFGELLSKGGANGEAPSLLAGFALNELQARQLAEAGVARYLL